MAKNTRNISASVHERLLERDYNRQVQWQGFIRKSRLSNVPEEFADVVAGIKLFLEPPIKSLTSGLKFHGTWRVPGPWV